MKAPFESTTPNPGDTYTSAVEEYDASPPSNDSRTVEAEAGGITLVVSPGKEVVSVSYSAERAAVRRRLADLNKL